MGFKWARHPTDDVLTIMDPLVFQIPTPEYWPKVDATMAEEFPFRISNLALSYHFTLLKFSEGPESIGGTFLSRPDGVRKPRLSNPSGKG